MIAVFVICAAVGTTVLVLQFLLALVGLGGDALGVEVPHDFGHDAGGLDHDLAADGVHGEVCHDHAAGRDEAHHPTTAHAPHALSIFRALSLRTVTAALAFFGLAGLAAHSADCTPSTSLLIAGGAGLGGVVRRLFPAQCLAVAPRRRHGADPPRWARKQPSISISPATARAAGKSKSICKTEPWNTWPQPPASRSPLALLWWSPRCLDRILWKLNVYLRPDCACAAAEPEVPVQPVSNAWR